MDRAGIQAFGIVFGMAFIAVACVLVAHWDGQRVVMDNAKDPIPLIGH